MAGFDASVIADIGSNTPDIAGSQSKALTLADLYDTNTLNKMKVADAKQSQTDMTYAKQILSGKDLSKLEDQNSAVAEITKRSPQLGMQLARGFSQQQQDKAGNDLDQLKLHAAKNDILGSAIEPLKAQHDELIQNFLRANPKATAEQAEQSVDAAMRPQMFQALSQLRDARLPNGQPVLNDQDLAFAKQSFANGYNPQAVNTIVARSQQAKEAIKLKMEQQAASDKSRHEKVTEDQEAERERHNRTTEHQGQERVDLSKDKFERDSKGGLTLKATAALAEQAEAGDTTALQGLKPADKVKVRNLMADNAEIRGTKGGDQAAANANFAGVKAGERTLGQRQANIDMAVNEAQNIGPILREQSAKVPREAFTGWNKLIQAADNADSDPELLAFAQAAKSYANIYTRATVPGASSVFDREEAVKHLPIFTSQESFNRVLDIMDKEMAAAKKSPEQVRKSLSDAVTGRTSEAGGVAPTVNPSATPAGAAPKVISWNDLPN